MILWDEAEEPKREVPKQTELRTCRRCSRTFDTSTGAKVCAVCANERLKRA